MVSAMTTTMIDEAEQRVAAFVAREVASGICPRCLSRLLIITAIDTAFDYDAVAEMHELLRRLADSLDECSEPARLS